MSSHTLADHPGRFALVGAGAIAQSYADAFKSTEAATIAVVVDPRTEAAAALAEKLGCPHARSMDEAERLASFDAAVVCTPPATHESLAVALLSRGVHVLCEKPLAIDSAAAHRMFDAAHEHHAVLTMASKFRYTTDVARARALINEGVLGDLLLFENTFTAVVDMSARWNAQPEISGGGVLIDNGTHSVDLFRYLVGPVAEVQAVPGPRLQPLEVEDSVTLMIRSASQVWGTIDLSWSVSKEAPYYVRLYGTQGTILLGWKEAKFRRQGDADWTVFGQGYQKVQAFRAQIENFVDALRRKDSLRVTGRDALASVEVIEAAYASLRAARWQSVSNVVHKSHRDLALAVEGR